MLNEVWVVSGTQDGTEGSGFKLTDGQVVFEGQLGHQLDDLVADVVNLMSRHLLGLRVLDFLVCWEAFEPRIHASFEARRVSSTVGPAKLNV